MEAMKLFAYKCCILIDMQQCGVLCLGVSFLSYIQLTVLRMGDASGISAVLVPDIFFSINDVL